MGYYDDHSAPWYDDHSGSGGYYDDHSGPWYDDSGSAWYDDSGSGWYDDASGPTYDDDWYVTGTQGRAVQQINDGVYYDDAYYWDDYTSGDDWYAAKGPAATRSLRGSKKNAGKARMASIRSHNAALRKQVAKLKQELGAIKSGNLRGSATRAH